MTALHIDFETRSELDLRAVGLHRYARHPSTDVWCIAIAVDDAEPQIILPPGRGGTPGFSFGPLSDTIVKAHNAPFELEIWNEIMAPRYGWPELRPEQTFCTMAQAYAMGLPGNLEDAALALGLHVLKDAEGRALMLRMSRPRRTETCPHCANGVAPKEPGIRTRWFCEHCAGTGKRHVWWDEPDKLARLYAYCQQDVRVERELGKRLMPLSDRERAVWLLDYKINQRGVQVDVETARAASTMAERTKLYCAEEISRVTGGAVQAVTAVAALKGWMESRGVKVDSLAKQALSDLLTGVTEIPDGLPDDVRRALVLRQEAGKASTAKLDVMVARADGSGRLRNILQYHGAATGRWAGRGVQTHNLPRNMPPAETVERVLELVRAGDHDAIDMIYGPPLTVISQCLRSFFVATPGKALVHGDWSNIEGRGQAWFAGEEWKLRAFADADAKRGPGLYELAYARMFNVPVESVKNPSEERQIGKVSELAFGYQGGVGSFRTMAKAYPEISGKITDLQAAEFRDAWRAAHPRIKAAWYAIERAAVSAVRAPGETYVCGHPGRQAKFRMVGSFLWLLLPSGRAICYPYPRLIEDSYGPKLTYMTVPSPEDKKKGKVIADAKNSSNWARVGAYGGSLFNNIVQGFCRDVLAECLLRLDAKGAAIVLHTHDDVNIEVDEAKAEGAREAMQAEMRAAPAWAAGLPLFVKCETMRRYRS